MKCPRDRLHTKSMCAHHRCHSVFIEMCVVFCSVLFFASFFHSFFQWVCLLMHTVFGFAFFCRRRRHRLWAPQFCFCLLVFALMLLVNFVSDQIYSLFSLPYTIFPTPEIITSTSHPIRPIQFQWLSKHRLNLRARDSSPRQKYRSSSWIKRTLVDDVRLNETSL